MSKVAAGLADAGFDSATVAQEYVLGKNGYYTRQTYNWIVQDLKEHPLIPGQKIILVGHSGGGAIVSNLFGTLEEDLGRGTR